MTDIQRLLNKTAWTGQDLGRLELTNMAVLFRQAITGQEQKPVVDREQFAKMVRTLTDSRQGQIYNGYIAVHEWISIHYNMAQTQLQQAQLQEQTLAGYVTDALLAEDVYRYMEQLPLILTEEQYEKTARENLQKWLYLKPGLPKAEPLSALLLRGLNFYLRRLQESPSRANPLKRIRRAYRSQPVKSELLRSRYNAAAELGYYELEDGRRSDEMTQEEWQEATLPPPLLREMRGETGPDGQPLCDAVVQQYLLDRSRLVFAGYSEEEANRAQTRKDYEARLVVPRTWHAYPDPPKTVYKWDVLTAKRGLSAFYGELFSPEPEDWEAYEREREDFFAEFPELIEALLADLETRFCSGETPLQPMPRKEGAPPPGGLRRLTPEDWSGTRFAWPDLYAHDVYGFRAEASRTEVLFPGSFRALANGVAVLRNPGLLGGGRDGAYADPALRSTLSNFTLEAFFPECEDSVENKEIVKGARRLLRASYYHLKGYNLALGMIAEVCGVPELTVFRMNTEDLEERIESLNNLVPLLYSRIKDLHYQDTALQARKLQVLQDFFQPVDCKALRVPEENLQAAKALLKDLRAFRPEESERFSALLCALPPEEEEV